MNVYVYGCMHECVYMNMYVYMYMTYECVQIYRYGCVCTYECICRYVYAHILLLIFVFWLIHSFLTFPESRNLQKCKDSTLPVPTHPHGG